MWEVLLPACLLTDPAACDRARGPGGADSAACREAADALARDPAPVFGAGSASGGGWRAQDWPCVPEGTTPAFPVTEIAPGVWVHKGAHAEPDRANRGDIANLGFVIGEEAVAVIDAGSTPAIARDLLAAIRARTALPVRWLILTHMHPDHALGAAVFQDQGATVIGHGRLGAGLAARAESYLAAMRLALGADMDGARIVTPDEGVDGVREIDLGGRYLALRSHPTAHTDNDLTVLDVQTGVRFLGDLLFMGHTPALDGALRGWIAEIEALAAEPATLIVPGHGPVAAPWPAAAEDQRRYLATLAAETRAAIRAGRPMLGAVAEIAESERPRWLLFDAFNQRNATAAYHELEWE
ncbi:MAG: quinoprotein relay system zinc metallohydrolase 2 [Rubrimonas sp.]